MPTKTPITKSSESTVGYGCPPESTRWRSGQSGNPKGRPKGSKNFETTMCKLLGKFVEIRENGDIRKIPIIEAIGRSLIKKALNGDEKAIARLIEFTERMDKISRPVEKITKGMSQQEASAVYARIVKDSVKER